LDAEPPFLLAIDQGTTSTRAILFDAALRPLASHSIAIRQIYPANGWVEHDPEEIWQSALACCRIAAKGVGAHEIAAIGLTNQRETVVIWDRSTGAPIGNAIVWQDRRTADVCDALKRAGWGERVAARTGLVIDPYFSATKIAWLLDHSPGIRARAERGELAFGTIDTWLIYRLTGTRVHATDVTNASRTMLLDLRSLSWDAEMLELFRIPPCLLPDIRNSAAEFGVVSSDILGAGIPIRGVAGDQQAAAFGQACFAAGDVKSTYGTGCFALVNTGELPVASQNRLITTVAYAVSDRPAYAIEGSIFSAGAVVQWLRDALHIIREAADIENLALGSKDVEGLHFVPAFAGLGAPYWDPQARGAISGLTQDMGAAEIARAALDAVCFQTRDLLEAMGADMHQAGLGKPASLKVDGGMVLNGWFCQRLADLTGLIVDRPHVIETTALGAASLAALSCGIFRNVADIARTWTSDRRFEPEMASDVRDLRYEGWKSAVRKVRSASSHGT
jgi:glycerol kinase